ncbi:sensor histidine kinase [Sphingobacterium bambusae]|uniref:histidine kinase n=1 Tax=Sphingobacterium bambusae TaxID=662858 RepID=A0ABW6BJ65_9SPHI|nr:HAMP domain-containing sensor histidine kinase [Sphingobacterium bambusae]WPL49719.1 HAMP domain-containing sensor histidine kinase [Sphingobacterium bambusae]
MAKKTKPLLQKTSKPVLIYTLLVFLLSIPVYFFVVDTIWKSELDEHNQIMADRTAYQLHGLNLSDEALDSSIALWNQLQPGTNIHYPHSGDSGQDSLFTVEKQKAYAPTVNIDRFRVLSTIIQVNDRPLRFTVETNIEESEETVVAIALTTLFFFMLTLVGILFINRRSSIKIWKPFRHTLDQLQHFHLHRQSAIAFTGSDIAEFEELNDSLHKLIDHTILTYTAQKEFTENASHELQTPLAILQSKLDLLMQSEHLSDRQYQLLEEMNRSLARSVRINKNLLLLTKIENSQFADLAYFSFDRLLQQCLLLVEEYAMQKELQVTMEVDNHVEVCCNEYLTEILINNLLLNAIRHTPAGGQIRCVLKKDHFELSNTGVSALPTDLIFRRFGRLSKDNVGSGLGLSIVREIAKAQQWTVSYRYAENKHVFTLGF